MNYYFSGIFSTIISLLIFYHKWFKYGWVGKDRAILYVLASLPFSAMVGLSIKKPIRSYLCNVLGISKELSLWPLWFLLILLFIGAFAEEWLKMLPVLLNKTLLKEKIHVYFSGLLVGLGFGIGEIWYLAYSFSRTQPEYASGIKNFFLLLPGFGGERVLGVLAHMIFTGMVGYGFSISQPIRFFLLAVLLHFVINFPAGLYQAKRIHPGLASILVIAIIVLLIYYFSRIDRNIMEREDFIKPVPKVILYENKS